MSKLFWKIPKCWVTRHHWLLINDTEHSVWYPERDDVYIYYYQCQVCGRDKFQEVHHLV